MLYLKGLLFRTKTLSEFYSRRGRDFLTPQPSLAFLSLLGERAETHVKVPIGDTGAWKD